MLSKWSNSLALVIALSLISTSSQLVNDPFIDDLMKRMTIEDKCGQMTQITLDTITRCKPECIYQTSDGFPGGCTCPVYDDSNPINVTKLNEAIGTFRVGSILNTAYDRAQKASIWQDIIKQLQDTAMKNPVQIPILYGLDSIHGANYIQEATLFPQPIAMAASFNLDIAEQVGAITSMETRAAGVPWNFNPVLDIGRQFLWPRFYETYGEDVFVAAQMGTAYIEGSQGNDLKNRTKVATCLKHYIGYSYPLNGRDRTDAWISDEILREYFLPSFASGVKAGSLTAMINSGTVNGMPGHANGYYINDILKGELGFEGFTVSDWEDISRLYLRDRMAASPEDAVRIAVMAGLDMSMVPFGYSFHGYCVSLAKKDKAFSDRVDDAVRRILTVKKKLGLFDQNNEASYPVESDLKNLNLKSSKDFNLNAAHETVILAKNTENFLPLPKNKKILVVGTSGGSLRVLNGGWSYKWQGDNEDLFKAFANESLTVSQAIQQKVSSSGGLMTYIEGANFTNIINIDEAVAQASSYDLIVLCVGEATYTEAEGNIGNLGLDSAQQQLADALIKTNKPIALIYIGGRPRIISSIVRSPNVKGVLLSFLPGNRGGEAIADVLFGDYNPDAKLPFTYPEDANGFTPYDCRPLELYAPNKYNNLFPFGHGLSYTSFEYTNLKVATSNVNYNEGVQVSVTVSNTGSVAGKETVILYLADQVASISRPIRQVKGFKKIYLIPGSQQTVTFKLTSTDFTFINQKSCRLAEDGLFYVYVNWNINFNSSFTLSNSPAAQCNSPSSTTPMATTTTTNSNSAAASGVYSVPTILFLFVLNYFISKF